MVGRKKDAAALVSTLDILIPMRGNRGSDPCELDKFLVIKYKYWVGSSHTDTLHDARGKEVTYGGRARKGQYGCAGRHAGYFWACGQGK